MNREKTLKDYLVGHDRVSDDLADVILAIAVVATALSRRISLGSLDTSQGALGASVGENTDGDTQAALDVIADEAFAKKLRATPVRWFASEERESVVELNPDGGLAVAIDPLDGSSNIDVNVSIGTIFSVFTAEADGNSSFLRPGHEQVAAGYVIYGPQTAMVVTFGEGVALFVLDVLAAEYRCVTLDLTIPERASEFAINASNYRHWSKPIRTYIDDCVSGDEGPRGKNFNMRWVASLVAESHRIMMRGGIFLYPADARKGYEHGRLRLVYECAPIAMLVENAGGRATDGCDRILDITPTELHGRSPLVFGSSDKVARVAAYHTLSEQDVSPLFGNRGLFRA